MAAKLGDLPEGVASAMFLRDGWPKAVVCKVTMKTGYIGIGIVRRAPDCEMSPAESDQAALMNALYNVSDAPPDYTELHEHVAAMTALALPDAVRDLQTFLDTPGTHDLLSDDKEPDYDLQASLGQPPR